MTTGQGFTEVPLGRAGTGEALILPQDRPFTQFSQQYLRLKEREAEESKANQAAIGKLMSEDIKTNWTEDQIKYFQPKLDALRQETIDIFKQNKGKIDPITMYGIQNKFANLKQEANLNNQLYTEEMKRRDELSKDALQDKPVLHADQSMLNRKLFANPYSDPEAAKEIKEVYGGNVNAWRAANQSKYANVRAFSPFDYENEKFKDRLTEDFKKDENGMPLIISDKTGRQYNVKTKGINIKDIETQLESIWNGTTWKDKEYKKHYQKEALTNLPINYSNGSMPSIMQEYVETPQGQALAKIISDNPQLASMTAEQQVNFFAKKMASARIQAQFNTSENLSPLPKGTSVRVGSGATTTKPANFYDVAYENIPNAIQAFNSGKTAVDSVRDSFKAMGFTPPKLTSDKDIAKTDIPVPANVTGKTLEIPLTQLTMLDGKYYPVGTDKIASLQTLLQQNGITNIPLRVKSMNAAYTRSNGGAERQMTVSDVKKYGLNTVNKTVTANYEIDIPALKKMLGRDDIIERIMANADNIEQAIKDVDLFKSSVTKILDEIKLYKPVKYFNLEDRNQVADLNTNYYGQSNTPYRYDQKSVAPSTSETTITVEGF